MEAAKVETKKKSQFRLSTEGESFIKKELARYESKLSATLPMLYRVQEENGWISPEAITYLSEMSGIPESHINEVCMFYTMFNKEPVGKNHVQVCCNISCCLLGARELYSHLLKEFDAKDAVMTNDKKFTFRRVECLGSCGTAPMMQVNDRYYENLTAEKAVEILKGLR